MSAIAIRVEGLSKSYRIGKLKRGHNTLRDRIAEARIFNRSSRRKTTNRQSSEVDTFWALKDVSFEVKSGEVVGIIGRNGAGKSTLLKILSRITEPTAGYADITGRVASLLEVGTGFHPELSGRDNIYLNGSILGMKHAEINKSFDEIVAFAEIEKFIDTPVKHYSSGMYMRLAFAVAAHLDPKILLVDEVLAVGDASFQKKCLGKMRDVAREGRTVLFVSHNIAAIRSLTTSCIWIDQSQVRFNGATERTVVEYAESLQKFEGSVIDLSEHANRPSHYRKVMNRLRVYAGDATHSTISTGGNLTIEVRFECDEELTPPVLGFTIHDFLGTPLFGHSFRTSRALDGASFCSRGILSASINHLPLMPGRYTISLWLGNARSDLDYIPHAAVINVTSQASASNNLPDPTCGPVYVPVDFSFSPSDSLDGIVSESLTEKIQLADFEGVSQQTPIFPQASDIEMR